MQIKLLKSINNTKRFVKWLDINHVAINLWNEFNPLGTIYKGLEKRDRAARARDKFCRERGKIRPKWRDCFLRQNQFVKANELLNYIRRRNERKK
jgi:hypothetical protein